MSWAQLQVKVVVDTSVADVIEQAVRESGSGTRAAEASEGRGESCQRALTTLHGDGGPRYVTYLRTAARCVTSRAGRP